VASEQAVELIRRGKGELLMKGRLHIDELMRAVPGNVVSATVTAFI
jgi:hypothetical protein